MLICLKYFSQLDLVATNILRVAHSERYGYLSNGNLQFFYQNSIGMAYPLIYNITESKVFSGFPTACFMRTVTYPESGLFLMPTEYCQTKPGYEVVPYFIYDVCSRNIRDPTDGMCLGKEEGGYRAVLSCDACQRGGFSLVPSDYS